MRLGLSALLLLLVALAGCGTTGSSLTGGGIPAGRATVEGTVVDSLEDEMPVPGAEVVLEVDTAAAAPRALPYHVETRTDKAGAFLFTGVPEGDATIRVTPPSGMHRRAGMARFTIRGEETASLAFAVEPNTPGFAVASLTVSPESIETAVGTPVMIVATATLADGRPIRPSWVIEGGVGRVTPRGHFMPTRVGTGRIRVRAGDLERVIPVVVTAGDAGGAPGNGLGPGG